MPSKNQDSTGEHTVWALECRIIVDLHRQGVETLTIASGIEYTTYYIARTAYMPSLQVFDDLDVSIVNHV